MVYLDKHLMKYPLMQIEDILKLHLQGILGPAHLISNKEFVLENITKEYNQIKDEKVFVDMIEEISDNYVRVYLKPYYELYNSFVNLVEGFYLSSLICEDKELFISEVKKLVNESNKEFINDYLTTKRFLISHSNIYKTNYHAHYLVVNKKYLSIVLNNN